MARVQNLLVYVLIAYVLDKTRKLLNTNEVNLSFYTLVIITDTSLQSFTVQSIKIEKLKSPNPPSSNCMMYGLFIYKKQNWCTLLQPTLYKQLSGL